MLIKEGAQWVLYSSNGQKVLGKFKSKTEAIQKERESIYFKEEKKSKKKK